MPDPARLTVGVAIRAIKAEPRWWLESAVRLAEAGYDGIWAWDTGWGRGGLRRPCGVRRRDGPARPDGSWGRGVDVALDDGRADRARDRRAVRDQRDEPPSGAP